METTEMPLVSQEAFFGTIQCSQHAILHMILGLKGAVGVPESMM
jgi:hypothetical protein